MHGQANSPDQQGEDQEVKVHGSQPYKGFDSHTRKAGMAGTVGFRGFRELTCRVSSLNSGLARTLAARLGPSH